jgi:hypothetical protein
MPLGWPSTYSCGVGVEVTLPETWHAFNAIRALELDTIVLMQAQLKQRADGSRAHFAKVDGEAKDWEGVCDSVSRDIHSSSTASPHR